jgi:hypothetical protein
MSRLTESHMSRVSPLQAALKISFFSITEYKPLLPNSLLVPNTINTFRLAAV